MKKRNTTLKKLRGLTNIPLGQVNNLAWMAVFEATNQPLMDYLAYLERKREAEESGIEFNEKPPETPSYETTFEETWEQVGKPLFHQMVKELLDEGVKKVKEELYDGVAFRNLPKDTQNRIIYGAMYFVHLAIMEAIQGQSR